jgi:N6-L-threonylcarbamoyladenine synthase
MYILSVESSCDETAVAIVENGRKVLADIVSSQTQIHAKFGGVVPELASRNHLLDIIPVIDQALKQAQIDDFQKIDAIAITKGPGLIGALLVGLQAAKSLAYVYQKPLIEVNHLHGHLNAIYLHAQDEAPGPTPPYPHVCLVVSGGHTAIYLVKSPFDIQTLANTMDDAAGEAFDKVARMLGLGYPGGPVIERLGKNGNPHAYDFPLPRFKDGRLDLSFSGLKTAVLTAIKKHGKLPEGQDMLDLIASFQRAAVEQLVDRTIIATRKAGASAIVIAGGVACNQALRDRLSVVCLENQIELLIPPKKWCTDNGAMIAAAGYWWAENAIQRGFTQEDLKMNATSTWPLNTLINPN